ncbi:uncharacterized protein LOC124371546 [Homalodisca vitripennis]|uniref:uncharacterized protein LOC124371546 n=1 Tax=Homalodisca vitripennis TaxID=197043 RepID=UPI001EEB43C2|nr:uncharacterized protein LOC124371546 [Homalodisca vitripennis]
MKDGVGWRMGSRLQSTVLLAPSLHFKVTIARVTLNPSTLVLTPMFQWYILLCRGAHRTIGVPQGYVLGPLLFSGHARKQPTLSNVLNDEWRRNEEPRDRVRGSCCVSVSVSVGPRVSVAAVQVSVAQVHSVSGVQSGQVRHGQRPTAIQTRYIVTMGGVWCKSDKGQQRSYTTRGHFNSTISRWTDHVRQVYRKPKTHHRPARPPQKPMRTNGRLTISHPQLRKEESSDGWRTATLMVPDAAPVPPPRKKRKRNQDLTRAAFSMDDLNRPDSLNNSTISLPDKYHHADGVLESRNSSSTIIVTPILETRHHHTADDEDTKEYDKENIMTNSEHKIEEEDEDYKDCVYDTDEIVPVEKETMFSTKTLLQSNLGYIDKLSAISEVSAESGFDDRTDIAKSSERSESVTSGESAHREPGLNILAHIQDINNVSQLNEINKEIKEKNGHEQTRVVAEYPEGGERAVFHIERHGGGDEKGVGQHNTGREIGGRFRTAELIAY